MTAAMLTVTGNVATDIIREIKRETLEPWVHFRIACGDRRYDPRAGAWIDGEPSFYTVVCWQSQLARNVDSSLKKGDPVVVHGKVRIREWRDERNVQRFAAEITANSIGHDLFRGTSSFEKTIRSAQSTPDSDELKEKLAPYASGDGTVDQATGEIPSAGERAGDANWPPSVAGASSTGVDFVEPGSTAPGSSDPDDEQDEKDGDESGDLVGVGTAA